MAGLFCFQSLHLYAELPPARSPSLGTAPAPSLNTVAAPAPTPEVRLLDLQALRDESKALVKDQSARLEEQGRRLSRTAASMQDLEDEIRREAQASKALDASVAGLGSTLSTLDKRLAELKESSAAKDVDAVSQAAKLRALNDDLSALKQSYEGSAKVMRDGLAEIASLREDLKQRQARLDSLTDLLSVIKKDVDSNSEEIVEVKQTLKLYDQAQVKPAEDGGWWDQVLHWKYLPAVAVGLSAVAVGIAAGK